MNFFLQRNGQQLGPYPLASLTEMNRNGTVLPSDLLWVEGAPSWVLVSDYTGEKRPVVAAVPPPLPPMGAVVPKPTGPPPLPTTAMAADAATVELVKEVEAGGRFVLFTYCISILVMTFKRPSGIVFLRRDQDGAGQAIGYSALSGLLGWWGIPWGPIWTIAALISNARGGRDITREVLTDRVGATAAAAILARRQKPAPASWLMNSFRVALVALPLFLIAAIAVPMTFGPSAGARSASSRSASPFDAANDLIDVNEGKAAFGNSQKAIELASDVSRSMKVLREIGFTGGKTNGLSLSRHEFLTYCDLREKQCIVIMHVPELRRFKAEAKTLLAELAWGRVQAALRLQHVGNSDMKVIVGLRGVALYDRMMTGQFVEDPEAKSTPTTVMGGRSDLERLMAQATQLPQWQPPVTAEVKANEPAAP